MPTEPIRFRPLFGRILAIVVAAVCLIGLIGFVVSGDWSGLLRSAGLLLLFAGLAWALFWRPQLIVEEHQIVVVNIFRTFRVQWPAVQRIDTRYALTLFTPGRKISVWAAPAPGVRGTASVDKRDLTHLSESAYMAGSVRPGDALGTPSGQAAQIVRQRWDELREAGHLGVVPPDAVRSEWNLLPILVVGVLIVAAAVSLFL